MRRNISSYLPANETGKQETGFTLIRPCSGVGGQTWIRCMFGDEAVGVEGEPGPRERITFTSDGHKTQLLWETQDTDLAECM